MKQPAVHWVIERILVTEKSVNSREQNNIYVFRANPSANRQTIKQAVETIYQVNVAAVKTLHQKGKSKRTRQGIGRTADWKKAYVKLAKGEVIDLPEENT